MQNKMGPVLYKEFRGTLYKYRPIDRRDGKDNRLRQIIVDNTLWFAKPSTLNDPHDCRPSVIISDPLKARKILERDTKKTLKARGETMSLSGQLSLVTEIMVEIQNPTVAIQRIFDQIDGMFAVFSASMDPTSSTQWAYYGNYHKGVCLGIEITDNSLGEAVEVMYSKDRPQLDRSRDWTVPEEGDALRRALITKSLAWKEEKEIRIIRREEGSYRFRPNMLREILFGIDTPQDDIGLVRKMVEESASQPMLYQCKPDTATFQIHREPI